MNELVQALVNLVRMLWPFRKIVHWQQGGLYVFGRFRRTLAPGVYPVIPWFMDVVAFAVVPAVIRTPRLDVTLKDGSLLSFSASATVQVIDVERAINAVDNYTETVQEIFCAVLADKLMDVEPTRTEADARRRLLSDLTRWVNTETREFGVNVRNVRFTTFVLRPKALRLLQESTGSEW